MSGTTAIDASSPITSTASLSSLPTEIKSQIVNYVKLQDESCKARAESPNLHESELLEGVLKENKWKGKSLNALFLVDMEWSELAAIHLFSEIDGHGIDSFTMEYIILPRRGSLVRSVKFNNLKHSRKSLSFLRLLPNLQKILLARQVAETLFGDLSKLGSTGNFEQDHLYRTFLLASKSITSVTLQSFTAAEATAILSAFPNVKELKFTMAVIKGTEEELEGLGNLLSKLSLKKLVFDGYIDSIPSSWITQDWVSPVTFIQLKSRVMTTSHLNFLNKFSLTLEVLYFEVSSKSALPSFTSTVPFEKLRQLDITVYSSHLCTILDLLSASPLVSLTVECHDADITQEAITINNSTFKFIRKSSSLRYLELQLRFIEINKFTALSTLCDSKGIILKFSVWNDQMIEDDPMDANMKLIYYKPALEKVLNYGQRKLIELEKEENIEGMEEMFENCKWLRANAAEMMD